MGRITNLLFSAFILVLLSSDLLLAGNGKLSGRILDAQTGHPVLGNVQLAGTLHGSAADSAGRYFILEIPPGTYDVRCSAVGYRAEVLARLVIAPDRWRTQDFALDVEEVSLAEMVIQAERVTVQSSQTSARTDFDGAEFRMLPLNSTMDLVALSPGTFKQFIGGVSPVFSRTTIDGIDVTDETALWYTEAWGISLTVVHRDPDVSAAQHTSYVEPNINAVEQSTLFTGTTGSDYAGGAGTLAYTLREGRGAWGGEAMVRVSQLGGLKHLGPDVYWDAHEYLAVKGTLAASQYPSGRQEATFYTWFPNKYPYRNRPDITVSLALGGALADGMGLHVTGTYHSSGNRLPNQKTERFNSSAKLTWSLAPTMRFSVVGMLEDRGRLFGWKNSSYDETYRYFLEGVPLWDGLHVMAGVKWSHFLSQTTSYEIQASFIHDNVRRGFCDDNNDGVILLGEDGDFLTWSDTAQVHRYQATSGGREFQKFFVTNIGPDGTTRLLTSLLTWRVARPYIYYDDFTSRVFSLKGDISSQVDPHHLIAAGLEGRLHSIEREMRSGAVSLSGSAKAFVEDIWLHRPRDLGVYVQDRMEYAGLVMNVGVRLEGTLMDVAPVANWYAPADTIRDAQGGMFLRARRGPTLPWKWFISPRVAFSHPIGHTAAVHASFSRTRLSIPYSYIFSNYNYALQTGFSTAINVEQEPVSSMNSDLGIQWAVAPATLLGVSAFSRDYSNMNPASITVYTTGSPVPYYVISNALYADTRGVELYLQRDLKSLLWGVSGGGRLAYAYSHLSSGSATANNKYTFSPLTGDSAAFDGRLPFGDMDTWNRSYLEALGGSSTLTKGFNRNHRITCAFTLEFPGEFRLSGTGMFTSGFWYKENLKSDWIVSYAQGPWIRRVDIRLEKQFQVSGRFHCDLFVDILNAFNWVNVLAYCDIFSADLAAWEIRGDPTGGPGINRPVNGEGTLVYDIPREVYFGVRLGF